ncbi:polysaccharide deacetylase family protein [Qipengyuania nanhaisediminis]|uniref:polysaccharide deacetylase family protein n=1 Tax=Qipengyuania nanhaisediminis TaxID=604088 RepID=UPI0038B3A9A0
MITPPRHEDTARFAPRFGQRVLLTVDTEEEFDWDAPFTRDAHGLEHVAQLPRFIAFCEEIGAHPVFLVDWPIAGNAAAMECLTDAQRRGVADIGVQLHPWVNPPFDEEVTEANSYTGNLPDELAQRKFTALRDRIEHATGTAPLIYRAGRYGLGPDSARMLKEGGIAIDTSVRSLFDYSAQHGPDYSDHPLAPYWVDAERTLLELPVTTVYWGVLRQLGKHIHRAQRHLPTFFSAFSRLGLLERIALTPEGVTAEEAIRGIDIALDLELPLLVLSFHSPTLMPGGTPYAETPKDVDALYDWLRQVFAYLDQRGVASTGVAEILADVVRD